MAEERLLGNSSAGLGGTLFSRCFWYTIIPVLTPVYRCLRGMPSFSANNSWMYAL